MFSGTQLRHLRQQRNLSALKIADAVGISRSYINLIEAGKRQPKGDLQERIASYFDVSLDQFQSEPDSTTENQTSTPASTAIQATTFTRQAKMEPNLTLTTSMLFGMVQGTLCYLDKSLKVGKAPHQTDVCLGQVSLKEMGIDSATDFLLFRTPEQVIIQLMSIESPSQWMDECEHYVELPDVRLGSTKTESKKLLCELVWFTHYTSLYTRIEQCRQWIGMGKTVEILDSTLYNYMS